MSVRKRKWTTKKGDHFCWVADYYDGNGARHIESFDTKAGAVNRQNEIGVNIRDGVHVPNSTSITIRQAGENWLEAAEQQDDPKLEPTTLTQYRQHLRLHIVPLIGDKKLSEVSVPFVRGFESKLRNERRSGTMVRYVLRSLNAIFAEAQERGHIVRNPVSELRQNRRKKGSKDRRGRALEVGIDIPTPDEVKQILKAAAESRYELLLRTAVFTGLRASELRGLSWSSVDLKAATLTVRQRADVYNKIGPPKTKAGHRTIPLPPTLVHALREWKLKCPKGELGLVFPNSEGNVEWHTNVILRGLHPVLMKAGVTKVVQDEKTGEKIVEPKYTGLHALRHFFASLCAAQGLTPKQVQVLMGHSNISVTMDTYTKIFPPADAELVASRLKAMETSLIS